MISLAYFDLCAVIILLTLAFAIIIRKSFKGFSNILFFILVLCIFLSANCSLSCSVIRQFFPNSSPLIKAATVYYYLFNIFKSLIFPIAWCYILSLLGNLSNEWRKNSFKFIFIMLCLVPTLYLLSNIFTNKIFYIDHNNQIIVFRSISFIHICMFFEVILCVETMVIYRKYLNRTRLVQAYIIVPIVLGVIVLQSIFPLMHIELFSYAIGAYLIFITSQRPELVVNAHANANTLYLFMDKFTKNYKMRNSGTIIFIKIVNCDNINLYIGLARYNEFLAKLSSIFVSILHKERFYSDLFYLENSVFAIYVENQTAADIQFVAQKIARVLQDKIYFQVFEILTDARICIVRNPEDISKSEYIHYFIKNFHNVVPKTNNAFWLKDISATKDFRMKYEIEKLLTRALRSHFLEVYYQPIYSIKDDDFYSAEALIRLKDPDYGFIPPAVFLPGAEDNGSIFEIGSFVFDTVCGFIASEGFKKSGLKYIQVNLSASQCVEANLVDNIMYCINKHGISPSQLRLEITEKASEFNPIIFEQNVQALHEKGITFALDDYGNGYSNIRKVISLPVDVIKLGKSFVDEIEDPEMMIVIKDTIKMLKELGKEILAEGVETEGTVKIFKELKCDLIQGCEYMQGFYFSKPLPEKDFLHFINTQHLI
ncbi:MAG: EAL domain-containing protein [Treponema sp.]|nr:EAL domain-containing protein [Treponema sp.]